MILKKGWSKMILWCTIARMFLKMHEIRDSCLFQSLVFQFFHVTRNRHESVPIPWTWMGTLSWRSCDRNTSTEFCVSNLSYHTFCKTDVLPLLRQRQESLSEIFVNQGFSWISRRFACPWNSTILVDFSKVFLIQSVTSREPNFYTSFLEMWFWGSGSVR